MTIETNNTENQHLIAPKRVITNNDDEKGDYLHKDVKIALDSKECKQEVPESEQAPAVALDQRSTVSVTTSHSAEFHTSPVATTGRTAEQQSKSTGEFYFANDPLSKQQIIDQLTHEQPETFYIRSLEDLEKHNLTQQVWLENSQQHKAEGRIFDSQPITLAFDLTTMSPGDIASINDILQVDPKLKDKRLGDQVRRVFLVNDAMLNGSQAANPDLWRRLGQMPEKVISQTDATVHSVTDDTLISQHTTTDIPENKTLITIDFASSDDWHHTLFGDININKRGQLVFTEGALANLTGNVHLVLYNAPWENPDFTKALATALRKGKFEANRQWVRLPEQMTISRDEISENQLNDWKKRVIKECEAFCPQQPFVCINTHTLDSLRSRTRVEDAKIVDTDMLANLLKGCRQLVITSKLDEKQWLWLLTQLDSLPEAQRPLLYTNLASALLSPSEARRWQTAEENNPPSENTRSDTHLTYEISPMDTLEFLQQVHLTSQNDLTFTLTPTPLMNALVKGTPLILRGLERNPKLAASLETLLLPNPYLFIHGHKVDLPKARVTFIRPAQGHGTGSSVIDQAFNPQDNQKQSQENPIYLLLKSLPRSYHKNYPEVPPWCSAAFQHQFEQQAELERQLDGSTRLMSCHLRRALHVLLAKTYRGDPAVYGFIKAKIAQYYPDQPATAQADRSALRQWLADHPNADLKDITEDFWTLARHCPHEVHQCIKKFDEIDDSSVNALATYVVGAVDRSSQSSLAHRLTVDQTFASKPSFFDGMVRSTLRDALITNKSSLKPGTVISESVISMETAISSVLEADQTSQQKHERIKEILAPVFLNNQLPSNCEDLPLALLSNQRHTQSQQERRLVHLANRVEKYPMIFLQGEAGAGKTFMAQAIAARADYPDCLVIQLGPNQTSQELFGGTELISDQAGNKIDHLTEFRKGPLLKWASSTNPPLLVLDEANLAPDGLLAPLSGLTSTPPVIHYEGHEYPLTAKHRVILTGNPDHYEGRHLDSILKSRLPTFFYHPLPDSVLARSIILPGLPGEWSDARKQQACDRLLTLLHHFKELVPGDLTTPRAIKDVLAIVGQIFRYYPVGGAQPATGDISEEQVNALIRRAFMDSMAGSVTSEFKQQLMSFNHWCQGQYREDLSVVSGVEQNFSRFLQQLKEENPTADFSPEPVRQLVYHYWQSLDKEGGGRTASLVEGPAGWGKDFILDKTIRLWQKQQVEQQQSVTPFIHINANPNQWFTLVDSVKQAMSKGQLIAISELNLIPSSYLEGLFNDVLTGRAAPGFRLFATINPGSFDGREALSPALKSRCTQIRLAALSQPELEGIIQRLPGMPEGLPQWLAARFQQLTNALDDQNSPVQLAMDDLFSTAKHLASQCPDHSPDHSPDQWQSAFQQHLSLPCRALKIQLPKLQDSITGFEQKHREEQRRRHIERIANGVPGLSAPVTVTFGNAVRTGERQITVTPDITDEEVMTAVQSRLNNLVTSREKGHDESAQNSSPYSFGCSIEEAGNFQITRYFPEYPYHNIHYRLHFVETRLDDEGRLVNHRTNILNSPMTTVVENDTMWRTDLREDELPGKIELFLNNQWQALPALTHFDELRAIRCIPETDIRLARSIRTGQLLIKSEHSPELPRVTIDFIIAPEQGYFTPLRPGESPLLVKNLCGQRLRKLLEANVFNPEIDSCEAYRKLQDINDIKDISTRLSALMNWLDTFTSDRNITGEDEALLLKMLREKQGACRHKAMIFQVLCHYWGIQARQVGNVGHCFVEITPDDGCTWRQYQLGGGGICNMDITEPGWGDYHQPANSVLELPIMRLGPMASESVADQDNAINLGPMASESVSDQDNAINLDPMASESVSDQHIAINLGLEVGGTDIDISVYDVVKIILTQDSLPDDTVIMAFKNTVAQAVINKEEWVANPVWVSFLYIETFIYYYGKKRHLAFMIDFFKWTQFKLSRENYGDIFHIIQGVMGDIDMLATSKEHRDLLTMDLDSQMHHDYIDWLYQLCAISDNFKRIFCGTLQYQAKILKDLNCRDEILKMASTMPFPDFKMTPINDSQTHKNKHFDYINSLPRSKYLESKIKTFRVEEKYGRTPKTNSKLIPGNLASGLPAFLTQSVIKENKPVVFDVCSIRFEIEKRFKGYIQENIKKTDNDRDELYKQLSKDFLEEQVDPTFEQRYSNVMKFFIIWLAQHQLKSGDEWLWFKDSYKECLMQSSPTEIPNIEMLEGTRMLPVEQSSEAIKTQLKKTSAIVFKENDFLIMFNEFLEAFRSGPD